MDSNVIRVSYPNEKKRKSDNKVLNEFNPIYSTKCKVVRNYQKKFHSWEWIILSKFISEFPVHLRILATMLDYILNLKSMTFCKFKHSLRVWMWMWKNAIFSAFFVILLSSGILFGYSKIYQKSDFFSSRYYFIQLRFWD